MPRDPLEARPSPHRWAVLLCVVASERQRPLPEGLAPCLGVVVSGAAANISCACFHINTGFHFSGISTQEVTHLKTFFKR